jgi:hypothetical protein
MWLDLAFWKDVSLVKTFSRIAVRLCAVAALAIAGTLISAPMNAASSVALTTATTGDKTATIGIPAGWTLAKGSNGYVYVTGPNDQRINLGVIVIGKNAAAGSSLQGEVAFALPYSTSLKDKFTTILQAGATKSGMPQPQVTIASATPTKLPMCAKLLGGLTASGSSNKFEAVICSLKPDFLGLYKNIVFMAQVPASRAAQDRPLVEQIVMSYRVTPAMFKKMLAAYTPLPPMPSASLTSGLAPYQDPTNSDCFDYNVIRESPPWEVPMHCGGTMPG